METVYKHNMSTRQIKKFEFFLQVMDKTQISRMRIGIVEEVIGGRLKLRYEDSDDPNDHFW